MIKTRCAICGDKERQIELFQSNFDPKKVNSKTFSARRTPDRVHYRIVKCLKCGLIFSNPIFSNSKINKLYFQSDFNYELESDYLKKTYRTYLKQVLPKDRISKVKLLEVGCGNGFFLEEVLKMGIGEVWGVEPGRLPVAKAKNGVREQIKTSVLRDGLFKKNYFDVICCFQTLDHLTDPNLALNLIYKYLKKGGKILFINHDTAGLSVRLFGEKSAIFDIEHVYLFNKTTMRRIFREHGFKEIKTFDVINRYPLIYWFRMVPIQRIWKSKLLNLINMIHIGDIPVSVKAGNLGLVATK